MIFKSHWIVPLSWLARGEITFGHWGEVSLEGGWAGYGEGTSIHSNLHGGDRKGGKGGGGWCGLVTGERGCHTSVHQIILFCICGFTSDEQYKCHKLYENRR